MSRMLVWPWHGLVQNSKVHLANGETRPYTQPSNPSLGRYGPGDTHAIRVADVAALTEREISQTPPGGEYWAGRALITGNTLYNRQLNGWIYQASNGSRWRVRISGDAWSSTSTNITLTISRFGEFNVAREELVRSIAVPGGYPDSNLRRKLFSDLGSATAVATKLHSVSDTGRTAILALSMFNTASQNDTSIDTRSRSYLFVRVSLAGSGASLSLDSEVLYGVDDVFSSTSSSSGGGYQELSRFDATEEIDREPIFDEHGVQIGDTVTYEYPSAVAVQDAPGGWRGPGSISSTVRWLVMVVFQGETPVPCYLNFEDGFSIGEASFSCSTDRVQIVEEFNDGTNRVSQPGISHLSGGGSSSGKSTISWQGPGDAWSRSVSYGSSASRNGDTLTIGISTDDEFATDQYQTSVFRMGPESYGFLWGSPSGRVPVFTTGMFPRAWSFFLYSNNLIAIAYKKSDEPAKFEGVLTPHGFTPFVADYPENDVRHFGSFNPVTGQFHVGSTNLVNWV